MATVGRALFGRVRELLLRDSFFVKVLFHQYVEMTKKVTRIRN
jgi:hypothetical protein